MKGTLRLFLTLCFAVLSMTWVQAQEKTYSGTVKSADDGQVIIGANVTVEGTTKGTSTGIDGKYTIKAPADSKLVFSYLGMASQTITAGNNTTINVELQSDAEKIEQVIVVAYGTAKKKDLTGSLAAVDNQLITSQANSTVSRALEGAVAGVQIASLSGQPGQDVTIRVRGQGTADAANAGALIVIDGVPSNNPSVMSTLNPNDIESMVVSKDAASNSLYGARGANGVVLITTKKGKSGQAKVNLDARWGMNQIGPFKYDIANSPKDIYEHAWLSIYNSARYKMFGDAYKSFSPDNPYTTMLASPDGANINPATGKPMTHEEAALFASQHLFDYKGNGLDPATASNWGLNGLGNYMLYGIPDGEYLVGVDGKLNPQANLLYNDDWMDYFIKSRFRHEYNFNINGATDKTDYFMSAGYLSDPSYILGSSFDRYSARMNVNSQIKSWLKVGLNMSYARRTMIQSAVRYGGFNPGPTGENPFQWINGMNQLKPIWARKVDGTIKRDSQGNKLYDLGAGSTDSPFGIDKDNPNGFTQFSTNARNLAFFIERDQWKNVTDDFTSRGYVEAKFLKDFKFTSNLGVDNSYTFSRRYQNSEQYPGNAYGGALGITNSQYLAVNTNQLLLWNKDFDKHHVDILVGHEYFWQQNRANNTKFQQSLIPNMKEGGNFAGLNGNATFTNISAGVDLFAMEGYLSRFNYNYDSKYYVSASLRHDGSSKFKTDRWGTFWSAGGAWRISQESFMENASNWVDDIKIRASYGTMGNQNGIGNYVGYNTWGVSNVGTLDKPVLGIGRGQIGNPVITWETVATLDLGVDFRFWDRFYGALEYYNRKTTDLIWARPIAPSLGRTTVNENSASMRTQGVEWDLNVDIFKTDNFQWTANLNGTHFRTVMLTIPPGAASDLLGGNFEASAPGSSGLEFLRGKNKDFFNLYMFKYGGVDQTTGLALLGHKVTKEDIAKGGIYADKKVGETVFTTDPTIASKYEMGSATPDVVGGFGSNFRYKNWDFSFMTAFQIGGKFFSKEYADNLYLSGPSIGGVIHKDMINNTWTPTNTGAKFPMQIYNQDQYTMGIRVGSWKYTDLSLFSASYLSIRNITLGYNLPAQLTDKWGIGNARVYASGDNLWLITAQDGFDPRMNMEGGMAVGAFGFPQMRTMSLGINITF